MTDPWLDVRIGDCREVLDTLPEQSVHCCVTSPPYWGLRDYGHDDQLGLESTPEQYVENMVDVCRKVRRVLRDDGTLWLNLGDCYGASKQLVGIPWRVAFALQADGWYLRSDIIWAKPNPMPESVTDRPTKAHEYVFLLSKSPRYFYDADAVREGWADERCGAPGGTKPAERNVGGRTDGLTRPSQAWTAPDGRTGRNRRTVWTVPTAPFPGAHFACFPPKLIEPCIMAGAPLGGMVLDPFLGSGTTGMVAEALGRQWFGIELNPDYEPLIRERTKQLGLFGK